MLQSTQDVSEQSTQDGTVTVNGVNAQKTYHGDYPGTTKVGLRISNGGAGQSGLIGAWADSFINYMVKRKQHEPFAVSRVTADESTILMEWKSQISYTCSSGGMVSRRYDGKHRVFGKQEC
jgi:hypothetical protein